MCNKKKRDRNRHCFFFLNFNPIKQLSHRFGGLLCAERQNRRAEMTIKLQALATREKGMLDYITKFEIARVIGLRSLQIQQENYRTDSQARSPMYIACDELLRGKMLFTIRREFPGGDYVDVAVSDLKLCDDNEVHLKYIMEHLKSRTY
jgi:DNA-directed RNA polymerase subunit K/omega